MLAVLVETESDLDSNAFAADFQAIMKLKPQVVVVAPGTLPESAPRLVDERTFD